MDAKLELHFCPACRKIKLHEVHETHLICRECGLKRGFEDGEKSEE